MMTELPVIIAAQRPRLSSATGSAFHFLEKLFEWLNESTACKGTEKNVFFSYS